MSGYSKADFSSAEGVTLAMAQSWICQAMKKAGISNAELARRLKVGRGRVTQILQRDMTMRTFARSLAACGYEVRFSIVLAASGEGTVAK
jgi:transcriptional regulator with XRE-family HTH domain